MINDNEKIKLNIFIKGTSITTESLDIKIFQQSLVKNEWIQVDEKFRIRK